MVEDDFDKRAKYGTDLNYKSKIHVPFLAIVSLYHLAGLYGFYLMLDSHIATIIYAWGLTVLSGIGVFLGAHRFYTHRSFKTNSTGLRLFLVICQTLSGQISMFSWVRDHRLHHKYTDTDADPHNPKRGFVYAHIGWIVCQRHPLAASKGKEIDMTDLREDKIVMFQKKHYFLMYVPLIAFTVALPMYLWNETFLNSLFVCLFARSVYIMNIVMFINSWAHNIGNKPFDKTMPGMDSLVLNLLSFGEGGHNYHHSFPWDYRGGESSTHFTSKVIDLLAKVGLAYDLKSVSPDMIKSRVKKLGDGSHKLFGNEGVNIK